MRTTLPGGAFVDEAPADWGSVEGVVDPAEVAGCVSRVAEGDSPSHPPIAIERSRASSSPIIDEGFRDFHPRILSGVSCLRVSCPLKSWRTMLMIGTCGRLESVNLTILPAFAKDSRSLVASGLYHRAINGVMPFSRCAGQTIVWSLFACPHSNTDTSNKWTMGDSSAFVKQHGVRRLLR
jgi:hypothetical protein